MQVSCLTSRPTRPDVTTKSILGCPARSARYSVSENRLSIAQWRPECSRYLIRVRDRTMPQSAKMPSITLSQLRDNKRRLAWLRVGKTVELRERNRVIAHILPVKEDESSKAQDSGRGNSSR